MHEKLSNYAKLLKGHDDYLLELDKIEKLCDLLGINFYEVQLEIKRLSESHITIMDVLNHVYLAIISHGSDYKKYIKL